MIKTLLSVRLRSALSAMNGKRKDGSVAKMSKGKMALFGLLYLYVAVVFLALFSMLAFGTAPVLVSLGLDAMYFGIFMLMGFSLVFIFGIFETKSELFDCKDNELLLSMPISPRDIVISRILTVLIYNYIEMAVVMLPAVIAYAVYGGSAVGVIGGIIAYLLLPLVSTALASGVGYGVAAVSRRIKKNSLVTTLISLGFLLIYFVVYFAVIENMEAIMGGTENVLENPALAAIGSAAMLKPLPLLIFVILSVGSAYLAYRVISAKYIAIATDNRGAKRIAYKRERLVRHSAFSALARKELRLFFSSSAYMLNGAMGVVFTVVLSFVALFNKRSLISFADLLVGGGQGGELLAPLLIAALTLMSSMNMISASALSLEGKNLWIPKSMPLSARDVLLSKCVPHLLVTSVPTILSAVLLMIACSAPIEYWAFFILTPVLTNAAFALLGIALNVAFPKFSFENEAQPIKQSMATFLSMITSMVWSILVIVLNLFLTLSGRGILASLLTLGATALLAAALYFAVVTVCVKRYEKF